MFLTGVLVQFTEEENIIGNVVSKYVTDVMQSIKNSLKF